MVKMRGKIMAVFAMVAVMFPTSRVHAASISADDVVKNVFAAQSASAKIDLDVETMTTDLDHPVNAHLSVDIETNPQGDAEIAYDFWSTDPSNDFQTASGTFKIVDETVYFSQDEKIWYSLADDVTVRESDREAMTEEAEETIANLEELLDSGVLSYQAESLEVLNGSLTMRYAYTIDVDRMIDLMESAVVTESGETYGMLQGSAGNTWNAFVKEHVTMSGSVWIDVSTMLPVMITSNVVIAGNESSQTTIEFSVFFKSFNESPMIVAPTAFTTLTDRRLSETAMFAVERVVDVFAVADVDGDGLSSTDEMTWKTNPFDADSDDDGYLDEIEVVNGYDPNGVGKLDSDGDGLSDYAEMTVHWTDPYDADSDDDGYSDGLEIANGYSPLGTGRW
jgi:hypothetical protein